MKAAMKQAKAMQSMKKQQRAQQGDIVTKSAEELQSEARAEQKVESFRYPQPDPNGVPNPNPKL